jgi:hypothetical protein
MANGRDMETHYETLARGLALRVTRVWFKRKDAWLEAYSYQTTIQAAISIR